MEAIVAHNGGEPGDPMGAPSQEAPDLSEAGVRYVRGGVKEDIPRKDTQYHRGGAEREVTGSDSGEQGPTEEPHPPQ